MERGLNFVEIVAFVLCVPLFIFYFLFNALEKLVNLGRV